jgi:hypothetical protein
MKVALTLERDDFSYRLAVNPIGRRLGAGGFISSRMAERMAAIAWSCSVSFLSRRASSSVKRQAVSLLETRIVLLPFRLPKLDLVAFGI